MPGAISFVTVTTATPVAVTASVYGSSIQIQEDQTSSGTAYPKTDLFIYHVASNGLATSNARRISAGSAYTQQKLLTSAQPYLPGDAVLYVKAVTATVVLVVDESGC